MSKPMTVQAIDEARRQWLKQAGLGAATGLMGVGGLDLMAAAAGANLGSVHAQNNDDFRALVCIFMFGGNDSNNLLVPTDTARYQQYARARGVLTLGQQSLLPVTFSNLPAGASYGLHPSMTGMQRLINAGKAAVVANVGPLLAPTTLAQFKARSVPLPMNLFSHSDQQAQWQSAISDGPSRTGWAGRAGELLQLLNSGRGSTCVSLAGNNLWEVGPTITSYKVSPSGNFGFEFYKGAGATDPMSNAVNQLLAEPRAHLFEQAWLGTVGRALENQRVLSQALSGSQFANTFPNTGIGNQLRMAARLISARAQLGVRRQTLFCSIGGFDTHGDDQIPRQQQLLGEISDAVAAFYDTTVALGVADSVTTFTASDFGRNLPSNGQGSDHGWGSHHLVVGGAVRGGALYGRFPELVVNGPDDAGQGVWVPTTSVDQYAGTLAKWLGVSPTDMPDVIPNLARFGPADVGFMA
jgi:uncharacterized protein (DUF1501 family)